MMTAACWAHPASPSSSSAELVFWEGTTKLITGKCLAGEIMFRFPDRVVCHADSFYIGHRIPALSIGDELIRGQTYFVLPVDCFGCGVLSSKSLVSLATSPKCPIKFGKNPFQYVTAADGRVLMKVSSEFIMGIITGGKEEGRCNRRTSSSLCSTLELQKHYAILVGSKEQDWSPKLETISEYKTNRSPYRLLGLDWRTGKMSV